MLDRLNRWLYSPRSPLNWLTRRRRMRVIPRKPVGTPSGRRLLNGGGIGLVELAPDGAPHRICQILPDGATVEAIIDVVENCPSGALSYSIDDSEHRHSPEAPAIVVIKDGPYMVGDVELVDRTLGQGVTTGRYTLCRCGASRNKPFCDGSHWHVGFSDES